jgi:hypothetical protein
MRFRDTLGNTTTDIADNIILDKASPTVSK